MSIQTTNFGLTKDAATDYYSIDTVNENLDKVDKALSNTAKFEKAGGTGTTITLTGIELTTGMSKTFIVAADNNGSATKINGKSLFKPGTTSAPKLITGKAVTVWYDAAGDSGNGCFFAKETTDAETVNGHTVESAVPSNAKFTDTVYIHPTNHPASIITQDANNRFITDIERASWNARAPLANPTFTGTPKAPDGTDYGTARLRNIMAGTADLTAGSSPLANGTLYIVYE